MSSKVVVLQLTQSSSIQDLEKGMQFIKQNFEKQSFYNISIVIRQKTNNGLNTIPQIENIQDTTAEKQPVNSPKDDIQMSSPNNNILSPQEDSQNNNNSNFDFNNSNQSTNMQDVKQSQQENLEDQPRQSSQTRQSQDKQPPHTTKTSESSNIYLQAQVLYKQKNFDDALELLEKSQKVLQQEEEKGDEYQIQSIMNQQYIGSCLMHMKKIEEAIDILEKCVEQIEENKLEMEDSQMYFLYNTMGYCYNEKRDYDYMIRYWQKAKQYLIQMDEQDNQKNLGHLLNNLGMAYFANNNLQMARECFEKSVEIYQQIYGEDDISVGNRMNNLAETYRMIKEYDLALEYFQKALHIKRKLLSNENDKSIANTLSNIGMTYQNLKNFDKAIDYFQQSIDIFKVIFEMEPDPEDNDLPELISNSQEKQQQGYGIISHNFNCLGECYKALKNSELASRYFYNTYKMKKYINGLYNQKTLQSLMHASQQFYKNEQFEKSHELFKILLLGQKQVYGEQSLLVGQTLNNLGTVLNSLKQYQEAIDSFQESIQILENQGDGPKQSVEKMKQYIEKIQQKQQQQQQQQKE